MQPETANIPKPRCSWPRTLTSSPLLPLQTVVRHVLEGLNAFELKELENSGWDADLLREKRILKVAVFVGFGDKPCSTS